MKYLKSLILFITVAAVSGCSKERSCRLQVQYGNGAVYDGYQTVYCDSFQMISNKEAYAFIDSTKMHVFSEILIVPSCND